MSDDAVYQGLIEWLRNAWPLPESEALLPAIRARYSLEDAAFLTGFPLAATSLGDLADMKKMDTAELGLRLDGLARDGVVFRSARGDDVRYRLNDAFFIYLRSSFWRGDDNEQLRAVAAGANQYYYDNFFENWEGVHHRGLRTLPIHETIAHGHQILPYEDVIKVVETLEYHTVSYCPCRERKKLDPDYEECDHPKEVCLHFGDLGRYCVENGMGREITKEETLAILKEVADSGLVHGLSNMQVGGDTICNCCECCCMWLEAYHKLGQHASLSPSNYRVEGHSEDCLACGRCVERCPMKALRLEESDQASNPVGKASAANTEVCIGCGVCVHGCPVGALTLVRIENPEDPPKDGRDFGMHFMKDMQAANARREKAKGS